MHVGRSGAALFLIGLVWAALLWFMNYSYVYILGAFVLSSAGILLIAASED